jgi:hypothetical protein
MRKKKTAQKNLLRRSSHTYKREREGAAAGVGHGMKTYKNRWKS